MTCREIRARRLREPALRAPADPELAAHLAVCPDCRRVTSALDRAREGLRAHHAGVEPDPGFSARVLARLRAEPEADNLAWAALRALPAALALVAALVAWAAVQPPVIGPETVLSGALSDDLLTAFLLAGGTP